VQGYAACFSNAVIHIARQAKVNVGDISVDAQVELFMNEENLPTLGVALHANLPGVDQAQAEEIVEKAHHTCPYSRATRGNIDVQLTITTDAAVTA
jgi:osmotically inducible protein OsmC